MRSSRPRALPASPTGARSGCSAPPSAVTWQVHLHAALDHLGAALECVSGPPLRIELEHARGRIAARSGDAARARDRLVAAAGRCEHDEPAKAAEILADAVLPTLRDGSPAEAARLARRSMRLAQGAGEEVELSSTLLLGVALLSGDLTNQETEQSQLERQRKRRRPPPSPPERSRSHRRSRATPRIAT